MATPPARKTQTWHATTTSGSSGELSVGDVVGVGEAPLAVGRAGWKPVCGGLTEVHVDEYGTHPLPVPARHWPAGHVAEGGQH
jgi:hypothetical protein